MTTIDAPTHAPADPARAERPERDTSTNPTLPQQARLFSRFASPRLLSVLLAIAAATKVYLGGWSGWDLLVVAGFIAWQPISEWLIHVYLLHWRPKRLLGITLDPEVARRHRRHHEDPWNLPYTFMPLDSIILSFTAHGALLFTLMPTYGLAASGLVMVVAIGMVYEWTHFLIHTPYRPRTRLYRRVWQYHRLHHFKNERYWFGVTMHQGDRILGTLPDPRAVETSDTARTLGLDQTGA